MNKRQDCRRWNKHNQTQPCLLWIKVIKCHGPRKNYSCCTFVRIFYHTEDLLNLHFGGDALTENETRRLKMELKGLGCDLYIKSPTHPSCGPFSRDVFSTFNPFSVINLIFFAGQAAQLTRCLRRAVLTAKTKALLDL